MEPAVETDDNLRAELEVILRGRTRLSSSGYPYLHRPVWARFRDWVPHILNGGARVLETLNDLADADSDAAAVIRQVVRTAAITAPPDLWIMRQVVGAMAEAGIAARFLNDEVLRPDDLGVRAEEIVIDFRFLLARGTLLRLGDGYRLADQVAARQVMTQTPVAAPEDLSAIWGRALTGDSVAEKTVRGIYDRPLPSTAREPGFWHPTARDVELGFRLVPLVLGMRDAGQTEPSPLAWPTLQAAGLTDDSGLSELGKRVIERGPGPFGIIEAYRTYLKRLPQIWREGRGNVWVERSANVASSQAANRKTFSQINDALDRFAADTGFQYQVFIEHAVGQGEAIRQRWKRNGDTLQYVAADLETAAIEATRREIEAGNLPKSTLLIDRADIGSPRALLDVLEEQKIETAGAVMVVGNGFHEVREQTDEHMTAVFRAYEQAGIVLIFTEETALAVDDLLETAWNTYHAGFKYMHERSGQGLRPSYARPPSPLEGPLPASWTECAEQAGYVRAERWCSRGRTVYPYTPPSGHNPVITANHFFVPRVIAERLKL